MARHNKKDAVFAPLFLFVALPALAIALSSFAIFRGVENYISTSNYFKVRELKVMGISDARYLDAMKEGILGTNIFRIDARKLSERIRRKFPTFYSVTVTRVLPSQLLVIAKERLPVALLKRDMYYVFDTEGVALSSYAGTGFVDFPLIVGLEGRIPRVKIGMSYAMNVLGRPLALACVLKIKKRDIESSLPEGSGLRVTKIDASNLNNLSFYLGEKIEIRVGHEDFEDRVTLLASILRSIGFDILSVKYIDLRLKEPTIAMQDNKKKKL